MLLQTHRREKNIAPNVRSFPARVDEIIDLWTCFEDGLLHPRTPARQALPVCWVTCLNHSPEASSRYLTLLVLAKVGQTSPIMHSQGPQTPEVVTMLNADWMKCLEEAVTSFYVRTESETARAIDSE